MLKTKDAFALCRFYQSIHDEADAYKFYFFNKGFNEPLINSGSDRIGSIEQSLRLLEHNLKRARFLIRLISNHNRRLKKFLSSSELFSRNFERAITLQRNYQLLRERIFTTVKFFKERYSDNRNTLRRAFNEELGNKIRFARKQQGYTQGDLARFLGITGNAYGHYELGRREIPPTFLHELAKILNVSSDWLLDVRR